MHWDSISAQRLDPHLSTPLTQDSNLQRATYQPMKFLEKFSVKLMISLTFLFCLVSYTIYKTSKLLSLEHHIHAESWSDVAPKQLLSKNKHNGTILHSIAQCPIMVVWSKSWFEACFLAFCCTNKNLIFLLRNSSKKMLHQSCQILIATTKKTHWRHNEDIN